MKSSCIYVAGHSGMVGSALDRRLRAQGCEQLVTATRDELDLCDQLSVREFVRAKHPDVIIIAAARVGGIHANNSNPAQFIHDNLGIALNLVHEAYEAGVPRVLFLGSSCIYPRLSPQPIPEDALLSGPLEPTNEAYALAKIGSAAMGAMAEKPEVGGRALVFLGMAEGIAIYGLIVAIMILNKM